MCSSNVTEGSNPSLSAIWLDCSSCCVLVRFHGRLCVCEFGRCRMVSHRVSLVCQESVRSLRKKLSRMRVNLNPRRPLQAAPDWGSAVCRGGVRGNRSIRRTCAILVPAIKGLSAAPPSNETLRYSWLRNFKGLAAGVQSDVGSTQTLPTLPCRIIHSRQVA